MIMKILHVGLKVAVMIALLGGPALAGHSGKVDITDLIVGTGDEAGANSRVTVHYTGWTLDGTKFDSSLDRGKPFEFVIGAGLVIPGWDIGVSGMKVGGKRELVIPPELAYGVGGVPGVIPENATLKFEVALLSVTPPDYSNIDNGELKALLARGVPIVDIRRADEWKTTGIIESSHTITAFNGQGRFQPMFMDELKKIVSPTDEVILICRTGSRTARLSQAMADQVGFKNIYNVTDGITRWIEDGNTVVKP